MKTLLDWYSKDDNYNNFLEHGGIKEQMSSARRSWREEHGMGYLNGNYGRNGNNGNSGNK